MFQVDNFTDELLPSGCDTDLKYLNIIYNEVFPTLRCNI